MQVYRWLSPDGVEIEARICELRDWHNLPIASIKALASGRQRMHRGWRCLNPARDLRIGSLSCGRQCDRLHRWNHRKHGECIDTVRGLADRHDLARRTLWSVGRGLIRSHGGWSHGGVVAEWPLGRLTLNDEQGEVVRPGRALQLWEQGWSIEEVNALLAGEAVRGYRLAPTLNGNEGAADATRSV